MEEVPHDCPGTGSDQAGQGAACQGCPNQRLCASGVGAAPDPAVEEIKEKMKTVKHKILVLSGKGGVGKSTFSAHLAHALAEDENTQARDLQTTTHGQTQPISCLFMAREIRMTFPFINGCFRLLHKHLHSILDLPTKPKMLSI
ncbi:nucleotide binding protein 1 [Rhinolophus ferrumequinum]|uniref:Nucleotide binding protein 1 n=1 Tax=Rhinolophus ferrumequinum TaxID=59479 RepID=A0A7J7R8G5_RHIFE|nr:nucleotide binding protein 1 [Rhinolophus ferrumequinum]